MSDHIIIRPVQPEDAEQLRENCLSANTLQEVKEHIAESIKAAEEGTKVLLVAEVGGVVVGTGMFSRQTHLFYAHRAEVGSLVVHPHYQRQGIARRLVEQIKGHAASAGIGILEVGCRGGTPAEEVYRRLGFVEWGRLPRGLVEPWGERKVYDEVKFYMPISNH